MLLWFLTKIIRREKENIYKGGKGRNKTIAIHDDMTVFRKPKKIYCKLLELLCEFSKVAGC